ncbi:ROK family protein [Cryobacterium psychrophilum]|uniref:ROK family protein n=1 Tax=Cryobacterium psychrophilum TaxID=41988 RepID=A0A4Y8KQ61_9MICO|nr:ROK family protein [Cryobacterium psychrophilum]TDW30578.1 glucokinase [Cryobacterium psychrophilum]TFD80205.1 ROK family protein [Cryobacterium psychrophilum]
MLAFDARHGSTKAALFDNSGQMLGFSHTSTPVCDVTPAESLMLHIEDLTTQFARDFPKVTPTAAGLIAPGIVDDHAGIAILSASLRWANVPYKRLTEDRLRLPSTFSNTARAIGEAEFRLGAARPYKNVVVVRFGTRITASLFIDGKAHDGGGFAGGIGHSIVDAQGEKCLCGSHGCLDTVASGGAIVRRYANLTGDAVTGAEDVLERARNGDTAAEGVWNDALEALALAISQVAAVIAPEAIVIAGGVARAGDELFVPLRRRLDDLLSFHRRPTVLPAILGPDSTLLGAALRARSVV